MAAPMTDDGHDSRYCGARTRSGGSCRRPAGWGTDHPGAGTCKLHLGSTVKHRRAAHLVLAERGAAASLADMGYEPIGNPLEALADVAAQAKALMSFFASKVADLEQLRYRSDGGTEQLRAEVALYERAMDRTARLLGDWVRLGFDERRVAMSEELASRVGRLLDTFEQSVVAFLEAHEFAAIAEFRAVLPRLELQAFEAIETTGVEQ